MTPPDYPLRLYRTATRQKEVVEFDRRPITFYACGPTVYDYAHIGNFRTYIFEDLLRRTIHFLGMEVTHVMNLTDVDDKTIKRALEENLSLDAYTKHYKKAFFEDLKILKIDAAEHYPAATDYISEMIDIIQVLLDKGIAYKGGDGSIYFAIEKFPSYGKLSHLNLSELQVGASERVDSDEYDKENLADFVLWKAYKKERDGSIFWESPFGPGRPGWHLECSALALKFLGPTIDIHAGGVDNIFPHHENEIAQAEAFSGKPFVKIWIHGEHLVVDGRKMSKSLGNFYTLRDLLDKGYLGDELRYLLLQTHYRTSLNFTLEGLKAARHSLQRLNDFICRLKDVKESLSSDLVVPLVKKAMAEFSKALADDLNISLALAAVFDLIREGNHLIDQKQMGKEGADQILSFLKEINRVLAVLSFEEETIPPEIEQAVEKREAARKNKNWKEADELRDYILKQGFTIEDTPQGPRAKRR